MGYGPKGPLTKDQKEDEHRDQFTALVREIKGLLNAYNCSYLSVSVLPLVNNTGNYLTTDPLGNRTFSSQKKKPFKLPED